MKLSWKALTLVIFASTAAARAQGSIAGDWKGVDHEPGNTHIFEFHFVQAHDGLYFGRLNLPEAPVTAPVDLIEVDGNNVRIVVKAFNYRFQGTVDSERGRITGQLTQDENRPEALELVRVGKAPEPRAAEPGGTVARSRSPRLKVSSGSAPVPFEGSDRKTHLTYELHLENPGNFELHLTRLEIRDANRSLASLEGSDLNSVLLVNGSSDLDHRTIGRHKFGIAFLWITLPGGAPVPTLIRHRITVDGITVEGGAVETSAAKPIVIGPPLRGSEWAAGSGPANESVHRRALFTDAARVPQRFAIDWSRIVDDQGYSGDGKGNQDYYSYGQDILAVADGVVAETLDGLPENTPGPSRAVRMRLKTLAGNHVVLDLGGGHYALYAHLQPRSLRARKGDRVKRGQVLGLVGNSGNASAPHLHFQITDGARPFESEGLPYAIDSYELMNGKNAEARSGELPLIGDRVRFP